MTSVPNIVSHICMYVHAWYVCMCLPTFCTYLQMTVCCSQLFLHQICEHLNRFLINSIRCCSSNVIFALLSSLFAFLFLKCMFLQCASPLLLLLCHFYFNLFRFLLLLFLRCCWLFSEIELLIKNEMTFSYV